MFPLALYERNCTRLLLPFTEGQFKAFMSFTMFLSVNLPSRVQTYSVFSVQGKWAGWREALIGVSYLWAPNCLSEWLFFLSAKTWYIVVAVACTHTHTHSFWLSKLIVILASSCGEEMCRKRRPTEDVRLLSLIELESNPLHFTLINCLIKINRLLMEVLLYIVMPYRNLNWCSLHTYLIWYYSP